MQTQIERANANSPITSTLHIVVELHCLTTKYIVSSNLITAYGKLQFSATLTNCLQIYLLSFSQSSYYTGVN